MKKRAASWIFYLTVGALMAQGTPNFSGTWILDKEKSNSMGTRSSVQSGAGSQIETSLIIKQEGVNLFITRKISRGDQSAIQEIKYATDGADSRNPGLGMGGQEVVSKSHWEGNKLVTEWSQTRKAPEGENTMKTREICFLSDDGKVLTIETTNLGSLMGGSMTRKEIFNKK